MDTTAAPPAEQNGPASQDNRSARERVSRGDQPPRILMVLDALQANTVSKRSVPELAEALISALQQHGSKS